MIVRGKQEKETGITLIALIITIVVLIILASISIGTLTGEKGTIQEAHNAKENIEYQSWVEQINGAIIDAENKHRDPTLDDVIEELKNKNIIKDESQVNKETGAITTNEPVYTIEGKLDYYLPTIGDIYYGEKNAVPTDTKYFDFTYNDSTKEARLDKVKDDYKSQVYYKGNVLQDYSSAIKDGDKYITDIVIPYEVEKNGTTYKVTEIGDAAFGIDNHYYDWYYEAIYNNVGLRFYNEIYSSFLIPNTIKKIGNYAFNISLGIDKIKIPESVTTIGEYILFFSMTNKINVYCEAESKPSGWNSNWCTSWNGIRIDNLYHPNIKEQTINVYWGS